MRFTHATFHTLGRTSTVAAALACDGGTITAVGSPRRVARSGGDEVDLQGRVVLPGLIDAHGHLRHLAQALRAVDLTGAASEAEAAARVAAFAAERPELTWISGRGWDQTQWPGASFPSAA